MTDDPQRVICSIVGGDPPDIIVFDRYAVGEWAARGAFLPLDEFVAADLKAGRPDAIRPDEYYVPCWEEAHYKGKLYGIPMGTDDRALFYNKDMLIRAGLVDEKGEAKPPQNWKELREYANKLSVYDTGEDARATGVKRLKIAGFVPNYGNSWLYLYGWQNGAKVHERRRPHVPAQRPGVVGALEYMQSIYDDLGGAAQVNAFQSNFQGDALDPFLTGQIAMKIDGNWALDSIAAFKPGLNFGIAPAPMPDEKQQPISWLGGWAYVVPSGAKHVRESWDVIRRLSSTDTAT